MRLNELQISLADDEIWDYLTNEPVIKVRNMGVRAERAHNED